jgi:hypothetical protein
MIHATSYLCTDTVRTCTGTYSMRKFDVVIDCHDQELAGKDIR